MPDSPRKPDLREISHLFLSSVRERQTGNAPRPKRLSPAQRTDQPVDLTPEELAQVSSHGAAREVVAEPSVVAVLAGHFEGKSADHVRRYAAHAAQSGARVGLIEVDAASLRVSLFDASDDDTASENSEELHLGARRIADSLNELAWDVDRWVLSVNSPRLPEARELMRHVRCLVLLTTCDADGIVAAYRTAKGAADTLRRESPVSMPKLSLAILDAVDDEQASAVFDKLSGVTLQFLSWQLQLESRLSSTAARQGRSIVACSAVREQSSAKSHWKILVDFIGRMSESGAIAEGESDAAAQEIPVAEEIHSGLPASLPLVQPGPIQPHTPDRDNTEEVIELPAGADDAGGAVRAVIAGSPQCWIECPIRPPMCPEARLAVSRDRVLTLLAAANRGLSDLRAVGEAYQWLQQNRALIAMAVPQLAIDAHQLPRLQLLVDHADASAAVLQPMLHAGHVSVTAYRRVRWSGRMGLLLEAA